MTEKRAYDSYINDISAVGIMTDEEEQALAVLVEQGDQKAINQLVGANLRYVVKIANMYKGQGLDTEDLVNEGNIGMMKAATKFKAAYKKRFVTFAAPYIRQSIESALKQLRLTEGRQQDKNGEGNADILIKSVDSPVPIGSQNTYTLLNILENPNAEKADKAVELASDYEGLAPALQRLDERERKVIERLFGIGCPAQTMMETAMEMGLKRERVRQIRDKALRKLKKIRHE